MLEIQHEDDDSKSTIIPSLFCQGYNVLISFSSADWDDLDKLLFHITLVADVASNNLSPRCQELFPHLRKGPPCLFFIAFLAF